MYSAVEVGRFLKIRNCEYQLIFFILNLRSKKTTLKWYAFVHILTKQIQIKIIYRHLKSVPSFVLIFISKLYVMSKSLWLLTDYTRL